MKYAKAYKALGADSIHEQLVTIGATAPLSRQQIDVPGNVLFDKTHITTLYTAATKFYNATTSTDIQGEAVQATKLGHSILLKSVTSQLRLINQNDSNCEIDIYLCMCKNSTASTRTPRDYWEDGVADLGQAFADTTNNYTYIGQVPFVSKTFNMQWKVVHRDTVNLSPGQEHDFHFKFKPMRIVQLEHLGEYDHIKGITYRYMLAVRGSLGDSSIDNNAVGDIGTSPAKYIGFIKNRAVAVTLTPFRRTFTRTDNLDSTPGAGAVLYTINDQTGRGETIGDADTTT